MRELLNELKNGDGNEGSESAADTTPPRSLFNVDVSLFDFDVPYEIECECDDPEQAKLMLEEMLRSKGNPFSYSKLSKFTVFRSGKLPEF
ncbi:triphosphate tunel metalloenzyme 3 [Tanacetum coccineum]|uniref:Triphosphate tunel metalloenzyme 3 n=1 Tax=Tanacetum coccineum TaxID=301880 RepID=A0ABQ5J850_9ASTR